MVLRQLALKKQSPCFNGIIEAHFAGSIEACMSGTEARVLNDATLPFDKDLNKSLHRIGKFWDFHGTDCNFMCQSPGQAEHSSVCVDVITKGRLAAARVFEWHNGHTSPPLLLSNHRGLYRTSSQVPVAMYESITAMNVGCFSLLT